ncbi:MBL fold metallo-hydrolase [Syntrophorhabdus aromaticivorans]|jgi:L-ascorbate metabolism protein UlaG (beta-lactamase superfamily)|uniref:MBL fold metallo-hydrolase n=1 Tax=Syntrophorhabdus aromaticivorans TaxID=328301 RepID=A0A351U0H2_9BACT|nr:MBL fold metallo-hydrolase [Syntrophorhabdus aromaticivorans]NLW34087.1 MBL fold metallo-hydrolase [Syntrophorhabdus aromaticivorans]HBA53453.1 MBL fold metallo-hydrolase [Syntrophorhabdus aromaticivorans]
MKIKWYGHAAFKITTEEGVRVIIDPYQSGAFGGALSYGKIAEEADIVLTSHDHDDHNYTKDIKGRYRQLKEEGVYEEKGVRIEGIGCYHDATEGKERGKNLIFVIEADGLKVVHMGDLGHMLGPDAIKKVGRADILLVPVGGFYTIDPGEASKVMAEIGPRVTIPMHYRTARCTFPIASVEAFTKGKKGVRTMSGSEIEIRAELLPTEPEIFVLQHAL